MTDPRRILIIRPSALGDVCRTAPALASLRARFPGATIDWLVRDDFAPCIEAHPALSRIVPFPRREFSRWATRPGAARALLGWLRDLARREYDAVYDLQGLFRSGLFALATRAPRRVGFASARELGWLGLNVRHTVDRAQHDVDAQMDLLRLDGVPPIRDMRLRVRAEDRAALDPRLADAPYALLAPTSRWPGKRWPAERFAALARALLEERAIRAVAVAGAPGEEEQCRPLLDLATADRRVMNCIGRTSVGGLMAFVERAALVVANDSAALHIAVGLDRPLVALFGPTRVDRVGPYARERDVLRRVRPGERLDHKNRSLGESLMSRISVDDALAAARDRLSAPAAREPRPDSPVVSTMTPDAAPAQRVAPGEPAAGRR